MIIATPTPGPDYYIENNNGPVCWDSFLAFDFVPHLGATLSVRDRPVLAGISGGGYGALKLALGHPDLFAAVAAMQPMLEPGFSDAEFGARDRLHHSASISRTTII